MDHSLECSLQTYHLTNGALSESSRFRAKSLTTEDYYMLTSMTKALLSNVLGGICLEHIQ
jgi:hypothetical protein